MIGAILLFLIVGAFFVLTVATLAAAIFPDESLPEWLRGPARHVRAVYDLVDELIEGPEDQPAAAHAGPMADDSGATSSSPENVLVQAQVSVEEQRFFLLQEIAAHCKFEPRVDGDLLRLTKREYRRLSDYCDFAFDEPRTPQQVLAAAGLSLRTE
jgi:hypothetical protein